MPLGEVGNAAQMALAHRLALLGGFNGLLQRSVHLEELALNSSLPQGAATLANCEARLRFAAMCESLSSKGDGRTLQQVFSQSLCQQPLAFREHIMPVDHGS